MSCIVSLTPLTLTSFFTSLVHPRMRPLVRLEGNTRLLSVRGWVANTSRISPVSGISCAAPVLVWCASRTMRSAFTSSQRKPASSPRRMAVRSANRTKLPKVPKVPAASHTLLISGSDKAWPPSTASSRSARLRRGRRRPASGLKSARPRATHHSANVRLCLRKSSAAPSRPPRSITAMAAT